MFNVLFIVRSQRKKINLINIKIYIYIMISFINRKYQKILNISHRKWTYKYDNYFFINIHSLYPWILGSNLIFLSIYIFITCILYILHEFLQILYKTNHNSIFSGYSSLTSSGSTFSGYLPVYSASKSITCSAFPV